MILPTGADSFREAVRIGAEVYHTLKKVIVAKVGDEGGFAMSVKENDEALEVLMQALEKSGHQEKVVIATDVAASEFYVANDKKYDLYSKNEELKGKKLMTSE